MCCRERYAGLYASIPYAIAQGDVEVPYLLVQSALFSAIVYFMIHFEFTAGDAQMSPSRMRDKAANNCGNGFVMPCLFVAIG